MSQLSPELPFTWGGRVLPFWFLHSCSDLSSRKITRGYFKGQVSSQRKSKMLLPSCKEPKLKGVFIWKLVSLRSLESFEGQWKKENTCWQAQTSAPSYKHQPQYFSQCVYDRIFSILWDSTQRGECGNSKSDCMLGCWCSFLNNKTLFLHQWSAYVVSVLVKAYPMH